MITSLEQARTSEVQFNDSCIKYIFKTTVFKYQFKFLLFFSFKKLFNKNCLHHTKLRSLQDIKSKTKLVALMLVVLVYINIQSDNIKTGDEKYKYYH